MNQLNEKIAPSKNAFQSIGEVYCLFLLVIMKYRYHRNENISGANLLLVPFLIYYSKRYQRNENISSADLLPVPFLIYHSERYHTNENISSANLLLVPFWF